MPNAHTVLAPAVGSEMTGGLGRYQSFPRQQRDGSSTRQPQHWWRRCRNRRQCQPRISHAAGTIRILRASLQHRPLAIGSTLQAALPRPALDQPLQTKPADRQRLKDLTSELRALGRARQWQAGLELLHGLVVGAGGLRPDAVVLCAAIGAVGWGRQWAAALQLMEQLDAAGLDADVWCCNSAISACSKGRAWAAAVALLLDLRHRGLKADMVSFSGVVEANGVVGAEQWLRAVQLLVELPAARLQPDMAVCMAGISACGPEQQWSAVLRLLAEIRSLSLEPTSSTYQVAVRAASQQAMVLLANLRHQGLELQAVLCSTAVRACGEAGSWRQALHLLGLARQHGAVDESAHHYALLACLQRLPLQSERQGHEVQAVVRQALELLLSCGRRGLQPRAAMRGALLASCDSCSSWVEALGALGDVLGSDGLRRRLPCNALDAAMCNAAVGACRSSSRWPWALRLLEHALQSDLEPPPLSATISACGRALRWDRGLLLLDQAVQDGLRLDVVGWNAALTSSGAAGQRWPAALRLLAEARARQVQVNTISINAVMSECERGQQWELVVQLLDHLRMQGLQADVVSQSTAIASLHDFRLWDRALLMLRNMRLDHVVPNEHTFNSLVSACEKSREWRHALGLLCEMQWSGGGLRPGRLSISAGVVACEKGGQWRWTLRLLSDQNGSDQGHGVVKAELLSVDPYGYSAALSACAQQGQWRWVLRLLGDITQAGQPAILALDAALACCEMARAASAAGASVAPEWLASAGLQAWQLLAFLRCRQPSSRLQRGFSPPTLGGSSSPTRREAFRGAAKALEMLQAQDALRAGLARCFQRHVLGGGALAALRRLSSSASSALEVSLQSAD
ncbi:unnamed protein product [Polarella glacialis]|uniref:Pentatricopeptide repeat-containing protein, chloroplastic n=1 Tax=Polarella glacialis TaxID=89957 RepID=A0A813HLU2_POLGL|nr:unnamed protein product [Polarella glacialis]